MEGGGGVTCNLTMILTVQIHSGATGITKSLN